MTDYISASCCRGIRPAFLDCDTQYERRALISKMMQTGFSLLLLVAPTGFGKSIMANQYAQTVYSYWHVFWFDCQKLDFLKLISQNTLSEQIMARDQHIRLVVFDDIPYLDDDQADSFTSVLQELKSHGIQVIMCLTPAVQHEKYTQCASHVWTSLDMLVAPNELSISNQGVNKAHLFIEDNFLGYFQRIPCLAWPKRSGTKLLLRGFVLDELEPSYTLLGLLMMQTKAGHVRSAVDYCGQQWLSDALSMLSQYIYLGINLSDQSFGTCLALSESDRAFLESSTLEYLTYCEPDISRNLLQWFMDFLMQNSLFLDASHYALKFLYEQQRDEWLHKVVKTYLDQNEFHALQLVLDSFSLDYVGQHPSIQALRSMVADLTSSHLNSDISAFDYHTVCVPRLNIRLWSSFEVGIEDRLIGVHDIRRKKALTLLALVALSPNKKLYKDAVIEQLWPQSPIKTGRRRLYNVCGELRRLLSLSDGSCPYFSSEHSYLALDQDLISVDIDCLDDILRRLGQNQTDASRLSEDLDTLINRFSGRLLPGEDFSELLTSMRISYDNRIEDLLIRTATMLMDQSQSLLALRYAREASLRDPSREDAYAILMRAQMANGQRASALSTYFSCQKYLTEELGVQPTAAINKIYEDALSRY